MRRQRAFGLLVVTMLAGCGADETVGLPAFRHQALYESLQQDVRDFTRIDGDWKEDFGDGAFYGLAFHARAAALGDDAEHAAIVTEVVERSVRILTEESLLTGDANEMAMCALGLVDHIDASADETHLPELDQFITDVTGLIEVLGHYLSPEVAPGYSMDTYGATSINGLMTLLALQRAFLLGGDGVDELVAWSEEVVAQIDARSWSGTTYEMVDGETRPGLFLYPNITMMIVHARLYQLTDDEAHRERALALYRGIQPLKVTADSGWVGPGRYRSPYSAEVMGAGTDDYSTLSSQNYLMLALMLLSQITGEVSYVSEVDTVLDFLAANLQGDWCTSNFHREPCDPVCGDDETCLEASCVGDVCGHGVLHHWMDGGIAQPEHLEFVCSGCNYQLLYLLWYRQYELAAAAP